MRVLHRVTAAVAQLHHDAGKTGIVRRELAVAERGDIGQGIAFFNLDGRSVLENIARYLRRQKFGEVVMHSIYARAELDVDNAVHAVEVSAYRSDEIGAFKISGRLDFFRAISARLQVGEEVFAVLIGLRHCDMGFRLIEQIYGYAGQKRLARIELAVVVGVDKDFSADVGGQYFAEVIVFPADSAGQGNGIDQVGVLHRAAHRADICRALEISGRLGLGQRSKCRASDSRICNSR